MVFYLEQQESLKKLHEIEKEKLKKIRLDVNKMLNVFNVKYLYLYFCLLDWEQIDEFYKQWNSSKIGIWTNGKIAQDNNVNI